MKEGLRKALLAELGLGGEGVNPDESGGGGIPGYQSVASNPYNSQTPVGSSEPVPKTSTNVAATPFQGTGNYNADINTLYQKYLGRSAGDPDLAAHAKNPFGVQGVETAILNSPEYQKYLQQQQPTTSGTGTTGTGSTGTKTLWGFDSPTGGKKELSYTPQTYEGEIGAYSGYDPAKIGNNDSIKYAWLEATRGLPTTVESIPEIVSRLNAMGIPATQVGYDLIDFGLGEGPVDILNQTRGGVWDWMPTGAGGGSVEAPSGSASMPSIDSGSPLTGDALAAIQKLLNDLLANGYSRETLLSLMNSGGSALNG